MFQNPSNPYQHAFNNIHKAYALLENERQLIRNIVSIIDLEVKFDGSEFYFPQLLSWNESLDFFSQITLQQYLVEHLKEIDFPVPKSDALKVADFFGLSGKNKEDFLGQAVSEEAFQNYIETERRLNQD